MPNQLSVVIDHYLEITGTSDENYKKHLRAAKELLELCDGNAEKAKEILDKVNTTTGVDGWSIYHAVRKWAFVK